MFQLIAKALGAGAAQFSANPAGFIVKLGRFLYTVMASVIGISWYTSWRNQRVDEGNYTSWPIPGVNKLPKKFAPDRPDKFPPLVGDFPSAIANQLPDAISGANGRAIMYDGKPVAGWIVPILKYARARGWRGNVSSGYRTPQEQAAIKRSGNAFPVAPPGKSNHNFLDYPGGAVDVTNAAQLNAILRRSPYKDILVWAGTKDPVHFSHPHDGGY